MEERRDGEEEGVGREEGMGGREEWGWKGVYASLALGVMDATESNIPRYYPSLLVPKIMTKFRQRHP